jgi:putative ABC transport system permease protein
MRDYLLSQVRRAFAPVGVARAVVLLVLLLGLADTLLAGVVQRRRELGALRAIGLRRRSLQRLAMIEGLTLGALGLMVACGVGSALSALWVNASFPYLLGWVFELHVPHRDAAFTVLVTMAVCLAGALPAVWHVARLEPAAALRHE